MPEHLLGDAISIPNVSLFMAICFYWYSIFELKKVNGVHLKKKVIIHGVTE